MRHMATIFELDKLRLWHHFHEPSAVRDRHKRITMAVQNENLQQAAPNCQPLQGWRLWCTHECCAWHRRGLCSSGSDLYFVLLDRNCKLLSLAQPLLSRGSLSQHLRSTPALCTARSTQHIKDGSAGA